VNIPSAVTTIATSLFADCSSLTSFTIPPQITTVDNYAFYCCDSLKQIHVPDTVTKIGEFAFGYTESTAADGSSASAPLPGFVMTGHSEKAAGEYADANGITFEATNFNYKLLITIIVAVLAVAIILVVAVRIMTSKKNQPVTEETDSEEAEDEFPSDYQSILGNEDDQT